MTKMYVRQTVADLIKWESVYDLHESTRKKFGARRSQAFVGTKNSNDVLVVIDWDSKEQANNFLEKSDIKEIMKEAGVKGAHDISFCE